MQEKIESLRHDLDRPGLNANFNYLDSKVEGAIEELELGIELAALNYEILAKDIAIYALKQQIIKED